MSKFDTYQEVTDAIIAALEAGTKPWEQEWQGGVLQTPYRINGEPYRGINVLLLWLAYQQKGLRGRTWMTFKQALDLGGAVRKGEKGTKIVFFKKLDITDQDEQTGEEIERSVPMLRTYTVFNVDQIDGLPDKPEFASKPLQLVAGIERDEEAEAALRSCGATILEQGGAAYYSPSADHVVMPEFARFTSCTGYLATLAHELCHWTGHKSRLDRAQGNKFGSPAYALEELVAELGAAFIGARLGFAGDHIENHAAYLQSWIKGLREDKRAIFRVAAAAQAAADMVLANTGTAAAAEPQAIAA